MIYISAFYLHISPAVASPSTSQLQPNAEYVAHFRGSCQQTYLGLKLMSCRRDHPPRFDGAALRQRRAMRDSNRLWLPIIMKKAFRTVWKVMGPGFNLHILLHTYAGASLKVTPPSLRCVPLRYLHLNANFCW